MDTKLYASNKWENFIISYGSNKTHRDICFWGDISIISFQGTFLKRYFKVKNHIYFSEKKIFFFPLASENKILVLQTTKTERKITFTLRERMKICNEKGCGESLNLHQVILNSSDNGENDFNC